MGDYNALCSLTASYTYNLSNQSTAMNRYRYATIQVLLGFLFLAYPVVAQDRATISPKGTATLNARINRAQVQVTIRTTIINSSHVLFPSEFIPGAKEVSIVSNVRIAVNGKPISVPRSVFLDLFDPHEALLQFDKGRFVLRIDSGDASNAGYVLVYFDAKQVTRRMAFSALTPEKPSEDTQYSLTAIQDK